MTNLANLVVYSNQLKNLDFEGMPYQVFLPPLNTLHPQHFTILEDSDSLPTKIVLLQSTTMPFESEEVWYKRDSSSL